MAIINIISLAGRKTFFNHVSYCGTRFSVYALTKNLREEFFLYNVRLIIIASIVIKASYKVCGKEIRGALKADDVARVIFLAY